MTESSFPSIIPKTKKTQKKTLSELHEQLLKKLNPDLIPPVSTNLSDIFKTSAGDDCSKEQERETEKETHGLLCGDPKIPKPREVSNGLVRSPDSGTAERRIEKGLYKCSVVDCRCSFNRLNDLKMHVEAEHPHLNSYPCSFCFNEFEGLNSMVEHVAAHVKNVFRCSHCQMSSDAKDELLDHISAEHPDLPKKITIYVKILNNDRQKRAALLSKSASANSEFNQNTRSSSSKSEGVVIADRVCANGVVSSDESSAFAVVSDDKKKSLNSEVTKSRSSRKSSRPIKCQRDPTDDVVRIFSAEKSTTVACDQCSFTCSSQLHLKTHRLDGHVAQNLLALLKCKICRFSTDVKTSFQNHMVHHRGRHVIRYYICPYCSTDTNSMDVVEEHILDKHPSEAFRFEVLQETVEFLEGLFECPVCRGMFLWKDEFVNHVRSVHCLDELAEYLLENFPGAFPPNGFVPKSLFLNLLPETNDFEEPPIEQMVVSSDEENSGMTAAEERKDMESLNEETSICVQPSNTRDKERVFQFNCHTCSYTSCDYDRYMAHFKTHDSEKPDSLIKKLLTKPGVPPYASAGQTSDLELDTDIFRTSPSLFAGRKPGGLFHCHLCPFTCTKTVHFKRHLAIHTRNEMLKEGYKCGYCQFAHYRLNCVKFHLGKYHGNFPNKMIRIMDGIEIELGVNDDPGKVKSPSILPNSSGPLLRTANEKRPTIRYGSSKTASDVRRPTESPHSGSFVSGISTQEMSLSEFELQLPASMIYPEAVKCPKCDFTNRVRINLIRHLKLHREEAEMNREELTYDGTSTFSKESSELRALMMKDAPRPFALNASKHKDSSVSIATNKRNLILDEKPLLRSILCEKPVVSMQPPFKFSQKDCNLLFNFSYLQTDANNFVTSVFYAFS